MSEERKYFARDAEFHDELERTCLREQELDPLTIRRLNHIGVSKGWRCLEVGAGGGSIAKWLSERAGPNGRVVVVDVDTRFLTGLAAPNVEIRHNDITKDAPEADAYDLVHCRALLMHLVDPQSAIERFAHALKPGGCVLLEEYDSATWAAIDPTHAHAHCHDVTIPKIFEFWRSHHTLDASLGRLLPVMAKELV
jgi:SAM-dependent methyltransferase